MDLAINEVSADALTAHIAAFGELLHACVLDGASIGFILPFTPEEATDYWRHKVLPAVRSGGTILLAARMDGRIVGTAQLDHDMMPNQRHRADVKKLLVHPAFRRRGIARALMGEIERRARKLNRTVLVLDTRTGDGAEPLYRSLGYEIAGIIPDYCRDTFVDRLDPTTVMYKRLQ